jgi:hypothetical protein
MPKSRRDMLVSSLLGAGAMTLSASSPTRADVRHRKQDWELAHRIVAEFRRLPGRKGLKILAPASDHARELVAIEQPFGSAGPQTVRLTDSRRV